MLARGRASIVVVAAAAALVTAAGAAAHGGTRTQGYVSTFSAVEPNVLGVSVNVFGPTNKFRLANYSGKTVVVLGYQGEPYLRFSGLAVEENLASPTRYLNASEPVPATAALGAKERWHRVARSSSFTWHDDRILWTAAEPPAAVRKAPDEPHVIFKWRIPATADGKPFRMTGLLGWVPQKRTQDDGTDWALVGGGAGGAAAFVALVAAAAVGARRARRLG
jgi:hypothetical protein